MRKEDLNQIDDNYITQKLEEAFGYTDEQLAAQLDRAAAKLAENPDPLLTPPEDEFSKIMARVNESKKAHKVVRIKKVLRPMLVAAVLGTIVLGTGIGVSGKREYEYQVRERASDEVVFNNVDSVDKVNEIEQAYEKIEKELGIQAIELLYIPKGMLFQKVEINKGIARMEFIYQEHYIHFYQVLRNVESSTDFMTDRNSYKKIYNRNLSTYISIYKNELEGSQPEWGIQFTNEKAYYILQGIIEEDEFIKIVERLRFFEN